MSAKIYVGNLSWNTTDDTLREEFGKSGRVLDSIVMRDRDTGRSRGFGFVTFATEQEAQTAIAQLNEQEFEGRRIKVNYANQKPQGQGGQGGGYQSGGGYGGNAGQYGGGGYGGFQQPAPGFQQGFTQGFPQGNFQQPGGFGGGPFQPQQPPF